MNAKSSHNRDWAEIVSRTRDYRMQTQAEVAGTLNVSTRTVQNWEAGMTPAYRHQRAILEWANDPVAA